MCNYVIATAIVKARFKKSKLQLFPCEFNQENRMSPKMFDACNIGFVMTSKNRIETTAFA